ncbi:putative membrane protein [Acinetobacter sp. 216872]|nr:hypothetical protein ACINWC141_3660 [Acinetobacter sp. WC-141]EXH73828.1 putative membrane protein [Acinetobacter sp. 216872]
MILLLLFGIYPYYLPKVISLFTYLIIQDIWLAYHQISH